VLSNNNKETLRSLVYCGYGRDFQDSTGSIDSAKVERWGKAYKWYLSGWLPKDSNAAIAELGCGYGRLLHFFRRLGYRNLQGVDISSYQVETARKIEQSVEQADVLDWLKSFSNRFDLLIALDLVEHLTREEALHFFELCFESIKPGGRLVLQTPNAESPFGLQIRYGDLTHEFIYSTDLLIRLLNRAKFHKVEVREQGPVPWGYSPASTLRWILWRVIRAGLQVWNISETGSFAEVLTRVFLISAKKPLK
jgi:SAM-dependent methyltransferase